MDIVGDVHTDLNTEEVLEEGVGSPFNILWLFKMGKHEEFAGVDFFLIMNSSIL
ncbi:hypothetical protein KGY73_05980 [bacterium]|nr:hypothetical protein [bacterium]